MGGGFIAARVAASAVRAVNAAVHSVIPPSSDHGIAMRGVP